MTSNHSSSSLYAIGLDLGQARDPAAIAVVERAEVVAAALDWVSYAARETRREVRHSLRHLERLRLGTPYPEIVARVRSITRAPALAGRCAVFVDATGVGAPVVDLLRAAGLAGTLVPVVITGGENAARSGGKWCVPKRHLVAALRIMLETGELRVAGGIREWRAFLEEMTSFRAAATRAAHETYGAAEGAHDDLVLAAALACWGIRHRPIGEVARALL